MSVAGDGHFAQQDGTGPCVTAKVYVVPNSNEVAIEIAEISGDSELFDRILDLAMFDPEASGTSRVVTGQKIHTLPHELRN